MQKTSLHLYFHHQDTLQLSICIFTRNGKLRISTRDSLGIHTDVRSFTYTEEVRVLCLLLLNHLLFLRAGESNSYIMHGAPAKILNTALKRKAQWLKDFFGIRRTGTLVAKNFLLSQGEDAIAVNRNALPSVALNLYLNEKPCTTLDDLQTLSNLLTNGAYEVWNKISSG